MLSSSSGEFFGNAVSENEREERIGDKLRGLLVSQVYYICGVSLDCNF